MTEVSPEVLITALSPVAAKILSLITASASVPVPAATPPLPASASAEISLSVEALILKDSALSTVTLSPVKAEVEPFFSIPAREAPTAAAPPKTAPTVCTLISALPAALTFTAPELLTLT